MDEVDKLKIKDLAEQAIKSEFNGEIDVSDTEHLTEQRGVFVRLEKHNNLRGGIGILRPEAPLYKTVVKAARQAAFDDPRFSPVNEHELDAIEMQVFILSPLEKLEDDYMNQFETGKHGLLIEGAGRALILPHVAEEKRYTKNQFLNNLSQKAGLGFNAWKDSQNRIYKFEAEKID